MDYAAISRTLRQFLDEHGRDFPISDFRNIEASMDGRRCKREEGVWELGSWTVRGNSDECTAYLEQYMGELGDLTLEVKLIRKGDSYVVQNWDFSEE